MFCNYRDVLTVLWAQMRRSKSIPEKKILTIFALIFNWAYCMILLQLLFAFQYQSSHAHPLTEASSTMSQHRSWPTNNWSQREILKQSATSCDISRFLLQVFMASFIRWILPWTVALAYSLIFALVHKRRRAVNADRQYSCCLYI